MELDGTPRFSAIHSPMDAKHACAALAALGQATRLEIVDLLSAQGEGLSAGEISRQLDVGPSSLSTHLAILARADLLSAKRDGRSIVYCANKATLEELAGYLSQKAA